VEITAGADLDVIEVDAATYSKVEQVRELTESLRYGPARDRYKVVVLDEIHRLSRQAFDALLKIVEEPPPHLVFVFATTEAEAVPATVLSRCQEFHFRRVSAEVLSRHLRTIAEAEDVEVSDNALRLIARAGEGSVRDSVALLDQLATFGAGVIEDADAARLVGGLDGRLLHDLLAAVLDGRADAVVATARSLEDEGWDPRQAFAQFLAYTRDGLHLAVGGGEASVDLPQEDAAALAELAAGAGYENLLRLLQQLLASEAMVRRSENGYLAVEIAWLRAAELPKLIRVEEILGGRAPSPAPRRTAAAQPATDDPPHREPPRQQPRPEPAEPREPRRGRAPSGHAEPQEAPAQDAPPAQRAGSDEAEPATPPAADDPAPPGTVQAFLDEVTRTKQPLAAHLELAELTFTDGVLVIRHAPDNDWLPTRLGRAGNRALVDEAVRSAWGADATWRLEAGAQREEPAGDRGEAEDEESPATAEAAEHPTVQTVLELFGGQIDTVEERDER
jgi:DNA polymerase-3 subunit gamma/tau